MNSIKKTLLFILIFNSNNIKSLITYFVFFLSLSFNLQAQNEIDYYNSGYQKSLSENYKLAIKDFTSALNINPSYSKARLARALCYQQLMDNEKEKNAKAIYYVLGIKDLDYLLSKNEEKQYLTIRGNINMSWFFYTKNNKYRDLACFDWKRGYELGELKAGEFIRNYCK